MNRIQDNIIAIAGITGVTIIARGTAVSVAGPCAPSHEAPLPRNVAGGT